MLDLNDRNRIQQSAQSILDLDPDPIPKLRILRDVIHRSPKDLAFLEAKHQSLRSKWVEELSAEQLPDGGWPRFHPLSRPSLTGAGEVQMVPDC